MLNLSKMKAPSDKRPTWRGGILQIHITRACDLSCVSCTQGSNLGGRPTIMTLENFERAVISLRDYFGVVGIFGGNPTLHPQFESICDILSRHIPFEQRGLWSNNLGRHGNLCRTIFNPDVSNLNVHADANVYEAMKRDWPECNPIGLQDSRHSPPYVAMKDMEDLTIGKMESLIETCDVNQLWSAMVCQFRGELRGYFCELAGAQSMLHEHEHDYPDTGIRITDGWWRNSIDKFAHQIHKHCFECGVPLRGRGDFAVNGKTEYVSKTHEKIYKLKNKNKELKLVTNTKQLDGHVERATDYIKNGIVMQDKKVLIGVPTGNVGRCIEFHDSLRALMQRLPPGSGVTSPHGQSPAANRNIIIKQALDNNFTHVLFLDDDLVFNDDLLHRLLAHNKDMVCGTYVMRSFPHQFIAFDYEDEKGRCKWIRPEPNQRGLIEITSTGLGAALINTEVFKSMIPDCILTDHGHYDWVRLGQLETDNWCDDIDFWRRARKFGYKLFLDLDTVLGHSAQMFVWPTHDGMQHTVTYESRGKGSVTIPQSMVPINETANV